MAELCTIAGFFLPEPFLSSCAYMLAGVRGQEEEKQRDLENNRFLTRKS